MIGQIKLIIICGVYSFPVSSHSLSQPLVCEIFFRTISQTCNSARKKLTASTKFLWNISAYRCSVYNNIPTWRNIYGFSSIRFNHSGPILRRTFLSFCLNYHMIVISIIILLALLFYLFYFSERMKRIREIVARPIIGLTSIAIASVLFLVADYNGRYF